MISIIIPTLNEEKILKSTLLSLKAGLTVDHEIIVSDGKSTDETVSIAHAYADKVVVYEGTTRQTIAAGRNAGAKVASGDILVFFDADCSIKNPDLFFKTAIDHFKSPSLTGLTGWLKVLPENANFFDIVISYIVSFIYMIENNILKIGLASGELQIIRKSSFEQIGGYNENLVAGEDGDMFLRLSKIGSTKLDSTLLVYHTGRRAHKIGWPRLLFQWFMNTVSMSRKGKSQTKEWTVIR